MTEPFRLGYRPALDGLRGIAILAVLAYHFLQDVFPGGFVGVDVFFVLSGFLITSLLLEEQNTTGRIDLPRFYTRRALRLLPALYVLILVVTVWEVLQRHDPHYGAAVVLVLLYLANLAEAFGWMDMPWPLAHTWSLSIEEQFYAVWPLLLRSWLKLQRPQPMARVLFYMVMGVGVYRTWIWAHAPLHRTYFGSDTHCDGLMVGCLVALAAFSQTLPSWSTAQSRAILGAGAVGLVSVSMCPVLSGFPMDTVGFTLFAALVGAVLVVVLNGVGAEALSTPPLRWIGRISYSLYLWHQPCGLFVDRNFTFVGFRTRLLVKIVASFGLAALSYYAVEKPFLRLKSRWSALAPSASNS